MRALIAALALGCVLTVPAVATDLDTHLDDLARRYAEPSGPLSTWQDGQWLRGQAPSQVDPIRAFEYEGEGWATLDGWMRGDPLLRQWVLLRFDADRDEALSAPEAATARHTFYALADANRSGIITSDEFVNGWGTVRVAVLGPYAFAG